MSTYVLVAWPTAQCSVKWGPEGRVGWGGVLAYAAIVNKKGGTRTFVSMSYKWVVIAEKNLLQLYVTTCFVLSF